jgi:hypothetical protein
MKPVTTFSLAIVLTSVLAAPGFAVVSSEQAREANARNQAEPSSQTTTPWFSTMSSANTPSHDGNSQLGTNQRSTANAPDRAGTTMPRSPTMGSTNTPSRDGDRQLGQRDSTNPAATNPGCGGAC